MTNNALTPRIEGRIQVIRGFRVMLDADLPVLYGVPTKALNQAVKRNANLRWVSRRIAPTKNSSGLRNGFLANAVRTVFVDRQL